MSFPMITGPEAPEEYPLDLNLGEEQFLEQISATEVGVFYSGHIPAFTLDAEAAHDAVGSTGPTTLQQTGREQVTLTVHFREGNPAALWAPFVYPITGGIGWPGGFHTIVVEMKNPLGEPGAATPAPVEEPPAPSCKVPSLRGYSLHAAESRLRAAHCGIGAVRLAYGATAGKGKVVKQFRAAGSELAAGTPVAVKLAAR